MGGFSLAYDSRINNAKSATFAVTLLLLFCRLGLSLVGCSPAEPSYVSTQQTNVKNNPDTLYFTFPIGLKKPYIYTQNQVDWSG